MSLHRALRLPTAARKVGKIVSPCFTSASCLIHMWYTHKHNNSVPYKAHQTSIVQAIFKPSHIIRWQQTGSAGGGGSSAIRLLVYGTTGLGATATGLIAYSSYNPAFKDKVNEYVPGFSKFADSVSERTGSVFGSTTGREAPKKEKVELVYKLQNKEEEITGSFSKSETIKPVTDKPEPRVTSDSPSPSVDVAQPEVAEPPRPPPEPIPETKEVPAPPLMVEHAPPKEERSPVTGEQAPRSDGVEEEEPKTVGEQYTEELPPTKPVTQVDQEEIPKQVNTFNS